MYGTIAIATSRARNRELDSVGDGHAVGDSAVLHRDDVLQGESVHPSRRSRRSTAAG